MSNMYYYVKNENSLNMWLADMLIVCSLDYNMLEVQN